VSSIAVRVGILNHGALGRSSRCTEPGRIYYEHYRFRDVLPHVNVRLSGWRSEIRQMTCVPQVEKNRRISRLELISARLEGTAMASSCRSRTMGRRFSWRTLLVRGPLADLDAAR